MLQSKIKHLNFRNIWQKLKKIKKRDVFTFTIFFLVSALFWTLNALRENYSANVSIPIKYINITEDETIMEKSHDEIILKIRGGGYAILRQKVSKTLSPITIDASKLLRTNVEGRAYILPNLQRENIQRQLFMGLEYESLEPDTLFVSLLKIKRKKIGIQANGTVKPDMQFLVSGPAVFSPDSIEISGPVNIVDTMTYVETDYFIFDKIKDHINQEIALKELKNITFSQKRVKMNIPIELFSEKSIYVPIIAIGLADSLIIKTFPSEVKITYQAGLSKFEQIKPSDFRVIIDMAKIFEGELPTRLRVKIDKTPDYLHSYSYSPYFVEYLLEKIQ